VHINKPLVVLASILILPVFLHAADDVSEVQKAVERSTLNQPGTPPFHLKASFAPKTPDGGSSNRSGEVERWWASPTQYRREIRTPEFHQIDVISGGREWQKNEGDYFPESLRELSVALVEPVPNLPDVLKQVEEADVKKLFGTTHCSWMISSTNGEIQGTMGAGLSINDRTGLLQFGSGFGWSAELSDYKKFHGRMVARTIGSGSLPLVAKITVLEDLDAVSPNFFDAGATGGDASPLRTLIVDEIALRKNLLPAPSPVWPALEDGPVEGALTTTIVVDRAGKVREVGTIVSNNPGVNDTARQAIGAMQFTPYIEDSVPVQVLSRITMSFQSARLEGADTFDSARNYFERGRQVGFLAAASKSPYLLHATMQARISGGAVGTGQYTDTWISDTEWRREASIGNSRVVRARHGDKYYRQSDGPDAALLQFAMRALEPIPAIDTFVESDWKIKRESVDGANAVRVLTGYVNPEGEFDPEHVRAFWFDDSGQLLKTYYLGNEIRRSKFQDFSGLPIARRIEVLHNGGLGMLIQVTDIASTEPLPAGTFEISGHVWTRAFTDEAR
jgi:hypothetical protein